MKRITLFIIGIYIFSILSAQNSTDSLPSSRLYQMTYIGVPLVVGGLIVKGEDDHFRSLRNDYLPQFSHHEDNFLQYAPATVMLGMKIAGVKGRSSWGRMLVSDAFSALLMGGVVNTIKHSSEVVRPDGSNNHSFPSGHTATAFMTATMLTKEYGYISPWVGIGAYTAATATGVMRMANNKHWLSDVLAGAGIGILSTELGYYITDVIFKDKGINHFKKEELFQRMDSPTFISLYMGLNIPLSDYDIDEQLQFHTTSGSAAGIEGAYFFNPYIGMGGRFTISNTSLTINNHIAEGKTFDAMSLCGGAYFSYPLSPRCQIGSKLLGGYTHYARLELSGFELSEQIVPAKVCICFGSGISFTYKIREHGGIRFFIDYNLMPSHAVGSAEWMNMLTCGSSISVSL